MGSDGRPSQVILANIRTGASSGGGGTSPWGSGGGGPRSEGCEGPSLIADYLRTGTALGREGGHVRERSTFRRSATRTADVDQSLPALVLTHREAASQPLHQYCLSQVMVARSRYKVMRTTALLAVLLSASALVAGCVEPDEDGSSATLPVEVAQLDNADIAIAAFAPPEQVSSCIEQIKFGAFTGDVAWTQVWADVHQTDEGASAYCNQLGTDNASELARVHEGWLQVEAFLAAADPEAGTPTAEADTPAVAPTAPPTPTALELTIGQRNAIGSAESYLNYSAFSASGLINQLLFEEFSPDDAAFAVASITVDWNEQAAKSAQSYLDYTSFSRQGLVDQLLFEGFSLDQATFGVAAVGY
jgi:hypothetical protein